MEWNVSNDPRLMLRSLPTPASWRKLRLFAAACCRRIRHLLPTGGNDATLFQDAIQFTEELAESMPVDWDELERLSDLVRYAAFEATDYSLESERNYVLSSALRSAEKALRCPEEAPYSCACAVAYHNAGDPAYNPAWELAFNGEAAEQAALLREIFGNPFSTLARHCSWSETITQLAGAVYTGFPAVYALRDSLLEAGQNDLANHFIETNHPKGCWVVDLILGRN